MSSYLIVYALTLDRSEGMGRETYLTVSGNSPLTRTCSPSLKSFGFTMRQLLSARVSLGAGCTEKLR